MSKKKKQKNEYKQTLRTYKNLYQMTALSVIADAFMLFYVLKDAANENMDKTYFPYIWGISLLIGIVCSVFLCIFTRKDYDARENSGYFLFGRVIIVFVMNVVAVFVNKSWSTTPEGRELGATIFVCALFSLIGLFIQFCVCRYLIMDHLLYPPEPNKPKTTSSSSSKSSSSSHSYVPTPGKGVENTQFYKDAYDKHYRQYMGYPPKEEKKSDYSDLDSHNFGHIFDDHSTDV